MYIRQRRVESGGLYPGRPTSLSAGTGGSVSNLDRDGGVSRGHSRASEKPEGPNDAGQVRSEFQ
jgi:hypothetical protein